MPYLTQFPYFRSKKFQFDLRSDDTSAAWSNITGVCYVVVRVYQA